jgi:DNA repair exonuclease SbcCD ATPase subunit
MGIKTMAEKNSSEFRFNADDQGTDEFYQEEMKDLRVEKLSQRLTILSILLPCLVAVAIYFGYRDLTGRMHRGRDSESQEIQNLSDQMETLSKKFNEKLVAFSTTLSTQEQNLGSSISGKLNTINSHIDGLNQKLNSINENLKQTKSAIKRLDESKADKKNYQAAINALRADWETLSKNIQTANGVRQSIASVTAELKKLENEFVAQKARIAENTGKLKKDHDTLEASISKQLNEKIDKAALGVELLMYKKNQSRNYQEIMRLGQKLDAIQSKIGNIQTDVQLDSQPAVPNAERLPPPQSDQTERSGADEKQNTPSNIEIKVQEQDLPPE